MEVSVRMPFGQYHGVRVDDLDAGYCQNLLDRWQGPMAQSLRKALEQRVKDKAEECSR